MQRHIRTIVFISLVVVRTVQDPSVELALHYIRRKLLNTKTIFGQLLDVYIEFEQAMEQLMLAVK